ncbi:hypothetical protein [Bacillus sp. RS11]|uniref:hypothetical protein n=1 Tax=Lysinibacillus sp. RS11 TaxID=3242682 RepID=UPI0035C710AB
MLRKRFLVGVRFAIHRFDSSFRRSRLSFRHFDSSFRRSGFLPSLRLFFPPLSAFFPSL